MKRLVLPIAMVMTLSGCAAATPVADTVSATEVPSTDAPAAQATQPAGDEPATTETQTAKPEIPADAPDAPDFSFTLGDGSEYQLSADDKPVYLIFWAEW